MDSSSASCSTRCRHLILLVIAVLFFANETHAACPSPCSCQSFQTVRCGYQSLAAVPVGLPDDTRVLYMEYNLLTKLAAGDFSGLSYLEQLHLYNNRISEIEYGAFRGLINLKRLRLVSNNISWISNRTFEGVPNLEVLHLRNNRLSSLPAAVFSQVPHLKELDLAKNDIAEFPADVSQDLSNVETIDLSYNKASLMLTPVFGHMLALQTLKLNFLGRINNDSSPVLISDSAFEGLINLRALELDGNSLNRIPFAVRSLPNLTSFDVYLNSIQAVDASDFYQPSLLQFLNLEYNSMVEIPTSALARYSFLTDVLLDYNPISTIPALAFRYNPHLVTLSLAYTNLTTIDRDAFVGLTELRVLHLQGNNLTTIIDGAMDNLNPHVELWFFSNPLRCDCHLREFGAWLKNNHTGILQGSPQCVTPQRLRDTSVIDVRPEQFACKPHETASTVTEISAISGMDVLLPCAIQADPRQNIHWITSSHAVIYPDQSQPPYSSTTMPDDSVRLLIKTVDQANEGMYTCVVSNDAGEARSSVTLRVVSDSTVTPTIFPATAVPNVTPPRSVGPTDAAESRVDGLIFGIAGSVLISVVALVIIAVLVLRRRNRKPKPMSGIPLPALPTLQSGICEDTYDVIPVDRDPNCDAQGYSTRINESASSHHPKQIEHTYFSHISDQCGSECDPEVKSDPLVVKLPDDRYSDLPTSATSDTYMTMKPQVT